MGKYANDSVFDAALNNIKNNATFLRFFDGFSSDYATINTNKLMEVAVVSGDFTLANGDISGRKVGVAQKTDITPLSNGNINHVAIVDGATVYAVTEVTTKAVTNTDSVTSPTFDFEIGDPT